LQIVGVRPAGVANPFFQVQRIAMEQPPTGLSEGVRALRTPLTNLVNQRRFAEAVALAEKARRDFPRDSWLAAMHAYATFRLRQHEKAVEIASEALRLDPEHPTGLLVLGMSHRALGHHGQAADALLAAHRKLPTHVEAACMLLEETVAAYGLEKARSVHQEVSASLSDRAVMTCWARLLFRAGLDGELPRGCLSAPLISVPAWMERAGTPVEFLGEREAIPAAEPAVVGEPAPDPVVTFVPGYVPYVCTLRDATVFAAANVVLMPDGAAVNDTLADERYGRFLTFMSEPVVLDRRDDHLLLDLGRFKPAQYDAAIMLSGSVSEHFGHWVPEYLCRLNYLVRHPRFAELPILVDSGMPPSHLDYLRRIVPNKLVFLAKDVAVRCRELIVASPSTFFPVHLAPHHQVPPEMQGGVSVDCIRFVRDRVLESVPPPSSGGRKIYLSRQSRAGRRPVNEDEISSFLASQGFEIVFPENLNFEDQVRLFQSAEVIVAPNGSSILNVIFAPKETKIFVLSQRTIFNWGTYCGFIRELGYDLKFICGDDGNQYKNASYWLSLDRLRAALAPTLG
jgi:capsular polysaccharide biosynthesis protein